MHGGVDSARVGRLARQAKIAIGVPIGQIGFGVQAANGVAGNSGESFLALGAFFQRGFKRGVFPLQLRLAWFAFGGWPSGCPGSLGSRRGNATLWRDGGGGLPGCIRFIAHSYQFRCYAKAASRARCGCCKSRESAMTSCAVLRKQKPTPNIGSRPRTLRFKSYFSAATPPLESLAESRLLNSFSVPITLPSRVPGISGS